MNKIFWIIILTLMIFVLGNTSIGYLNLPHYITKVETESDARNIMDNFLYIANLAQNQNFIVYSSTPFASDMKEGEIYLYYAGSTYGIATKINGNIKYFRPIN